MRTYTLERLAEWDRLLCRRFNRASEFAGLRIVLDARVPAVVEQYIRGDVDAFLDGHDLTRADIEWWVCHPGGPKVIEALQAALEIPRDAVQLTWDSLARIGNLSSASVLHVLEDTLRERAPRPGSYGIVLAMGPGFCSELVLVRATGSAAQPAPEPAENRAPVDA